MKTKRVPFKVSLLPLAESLDAARQLANASPVTAPQSGVYGQVSIALRDTLAKMAGISRGERMYDHLIEDGMTVAEARRATEPALPAPEPSVACRHCGVVIEPTEPMGAWIHAGLSIYCPGSGNLLTATPN